LEKLINHFFVIPRNSRDRTRAKNFGEQHCFPRSGGLQRSEEGEETIRTQKEEVEKERKEKLEREIKELEENWKRRGGRRKRR
jgi:hypothetical protein